MNGLIQRSVPRPVRNWLRNPACSAEYLFDRLAFVFGSIHKVSPREGWSLRCHPASRKYFEVFCGDPAQAEELDTFLEHCRPGMRLLDAGAHHGLFALAALQVGGTQARVVCVEASPGAAAVLSANLRLNGVDHRADIVVAAIGGADGELEMLTTGPFAGDYLVVPTTPRADTTNIPQFTMSTLLESVGMIPTHVKMDIEGFELEALTAAAEVLTRLHPVIFLEIHGDLLRQRGREPEELVRLLRACGYRRFVCGAHTMSDADLRRSAFNVRVVCTST
jgi:FkbM family methyltransferase